MQTHQGFYKFKKTVTPKVFDNGYIRDTLVRLKDNSDGYSYIMSSAGDMIKSIGANVIDVSNQTYAYSGSTYRYTTSNDGSIITIDTDGTAKTTNSQMCSNYMEIPIFGPCIVVFRITHISGRYYKYNDPDTPVRLGHQILVSTGDETIRSTYSSASAPVEGEEINTIEITQEDIDAGAILLKMRPWANGTSGGGSVFDNLKYTIEAQITEDGIFRSEEEYEPYKETTKVCDQYGHCYCMTYKNGTVYSENRNEISVDYPKSDFAMKFRTICNRMQNIDGADVGSENRKIMFFGDSITAGSGATQLYHMWLSRYTGFKCLNWGVGGAGYLREDFATAYIGYGNEGRGIQAKHEGNNTVIKRMEEVGDFENCFIFAGTNEYGGNFNIDDFRTAVQNTLDYAQSKASRILVLTPIRRPNFDNANSAGHKLHDYSGVIIEECMARGIPYIDGFDIPMNSNNQQSKEWYYNKGDGLHPSNNGHKFMAGWILDKFKAVFKV